MLTKKNPMGRRRTVAALVILALLLGSAAIGAAPLDEAEAAADAGRYAQAERLARARLAENEDDLRARFLLARVLAYQGKNEASLAEYDRLLEAAPDNADYLLGQGQTLIWTGRPREALAPLRRARRIAPDYEAVWRTELQALRQAGELARARALRTEAAARFPDSNWTPPPATASAAGPRPELELGYTYDSLDNDFDDWWSYYLQGDVQTAGGQTFYGQLRQTERFELEDEELMAGVYLPFAQSWTAHFEGSYSPSGEVLPEWSVLAELGRSFSGGWGVQLGGRYLEYQGPNSTRESLAVERYFGSFRAAYTLTASQIEDESDTSLAHLVRLDYYYGDGSRIGIGYADGEEQERIGEDQLLTTDVQAFFLAGRHWFAPNWAISYSAGVQDQGDIYTREGVQIGLRRRF